MSARAKDRCAKSAKRKKRRKKERRKERKKERKKARKKERKKKKNCPMPILLAVVYQPTVSIRFL
jgi:hypothetical protein